MDIKDIMKITCPHCNKKFRPIEMFNKKKIKEQVDANIKKGTVNENAKLVEKNKVCGVCGEALELLWTVEHGKAVCIHCGASYYHEDGKTRCGVKEDIRSGLRAVWTKHKDDLEQYTKEEKSMNLSQNVKTEVKEYDLSEDKDTPKLPKHLSPGQVLKAVSALEGRELRDVSEKIEILDGRGVLVYQEYNPKVKGDGPVFYTFERLSTAFAVLEAAK